jgi:hypothetical protein
MGVLSFSHCGGDRFYTPHKGEVNQLIVPGSWVAVDTSERHDRLQGRQHALGQHHQIGERGFSRLSSEFNVSSDPAKQQRLIIQRDQAAAH